MRTITSVTELRTALAAVRAAGRSIGFVPTMGALHDGHRSLIRLSKRQTDVTVVSIFVNPTQFGANEDFDKYPRTVEADSKILVEDDVDYLFLPEKSEIYPAGGTTTVHVAGVTEQFEGAIRPGHFDGVSTVVSILFNLVQPTFAFFGQKDAQQVAVVRRMVKDLHIPVQIVVGETIREADGLAMSSRNRMLDPEQLRRSQALSEALQAVSKALAQNVGEGVEGAVAVGRAHFGAAAPEAALDYLAVVDSETFQHLTSFENLTASRSAVIIIAARFGSVRLIDNLPVASLPPTIPRA